MRIHKIIKTNQPFTKFCNLIGISSPEIQWNPLIGNTLGGDQSVPFNRLSQLNNVEREKT